MKQFYKMKKPMTFTAFLFVVIQINVYLSPVTMAQVTTGNLQGLVHDPNGAVVVGAKVKVTNLDSGQSAEITTNEEGYYRVTNLIPGDNYRIDVSAGGFSNRSLEKVGI